MIQVISYTLVIAVIGAVFGAAIGAVVSGLLFLFIGWTWWPLIVGGFVLAAISGLHEYTYSTQPWRG